MRAVVVPGICEAADLRVSVVGDPHPQQDQVLIAVRNSGVCGHDVLSRRGLFPKTTYPVILGHEIAGEIVEVGTGIRSFSVGDRVATIQLQPCGACRICRAGRDTLCRSGSGFFGDESPGGYAELVAAAETALVALPDDVSFEVGSILACAVGTAFHAIRTQVGLRVGESILITGATGGVGAHAVQIAKLAGARVIAVTSSPSKMESLLDSGADDVIMTGTHDLANEVRKLTNGEGVDAVLEIVGAATFPASVLSLRPGGRLVFLGNISAESVQLAPGLVIMEELEIKGADACSKNELANVIELVQRSQIRPCIEATFPLEEAGRAHQLLEDRKVTGRIVLSCQA